MPSTPFDTAHQDSLRTLIGKVLPDVGAQPIAAAVAAGYGYGTHDALLQAIHAVEAGHPAPAHDFDADRLLDRLQALGEPVGAQDEALRFLLRVMVDGPRSGAPPKQTAPDETLARHYLRTGCLYIEVGLWEDAGSLLGTAMDVAPIDVKPEIAAALERAAPHAETAATNLALALLFADGVALDMPRAGALLKRLTRVQSWDVRGIAHNWLGHIASGQFGGRPAAAAALSHFDQAAKFGHAEAAFNAGLMYQHGNGVRPSQDIARNLYRRAAELGHVASMTNYACTIMEQDPEEAIALLEEAAAAGDDKAAGLLDAWTETGMARVAEGGFDLEDDDSSPSLVRVVPAGTWRPKATPRRCGTVPARHRRTRKGSLPSCSASTAGASWCGRPRRAGRTRRTRRATSPRSNAAGPTRPMCLPSAATWDRRLPRSPSRRCGPRPRRAGPCWTVTHRPACEPHRTPMPRLATVRIWTTRTILTAWRTLMRPRLPPRWASSWKPPASIRRAIR